jgi:hypothetical protein
MKPDIDFTDPASLLRLLSPEEREKYVNDMILYGKGIIEFDGEGASYVSVLDFNHR